MGALYRPHKVKGCTSDLKLNSVKNTTLTTCVRDKTDKRKSKASRPYQASAKRYLKILRPLEYVINICGYLSDLLHDLSGLMDSPLVQLTLNELPM